MRISWSKHQVSSDPTQPSRYLLAEYVPRWISGRKVIEQRRPKPELVRGDPFVMQAYLAVQRTQRRYRSLVLSFHEDDIDVAAFNSGSLKERGQASAALSFALETAFPGIPPANHPPILASTHTHLDVSKSILSFLVSFTVMMGQFAAITPIRPNLLLDVFGVSRKIF